MMRTSLVVAALVAAIGCSKKETSGDPATDKSAGAATGNGGNAAAENPFAGAAGEEAKTNLAKIAKAMSEAYENPAQVGGQTPVTKSLCKSASAIPAFIDFVKDGKKYTSSAAEWSQDAVENTGFACLKFSIDGPQLWQYSVETSGDKFTAYARRLVGKEIAEQSITGTVGPDQTLKVAPNIVETRKPN